ncbi:cytochrome P450 family protein [Wenjunlia tyrosinilytica]|nr:cytochrome P450 [Wenjunlia tyrosinilytica]
MDATTARAPFRLDPEGGDRHAENAQLRDIAAAVEVELPDGVTAWAVPRHEALHRLLSDPRVAKGAEHWSALANGEVPETWPMIGIVSGKSMMTADGQSHRRLRALVSEAFTPRRTEALRPRVEQITHELLDALAAEAPGPVDLRERFAYPLPMSVISELLGVPEEDRDMLHELSVSIVSTSTGPADVLATQRAMYGYLDSLVAAKRRSPADDVTSALIATHDEGDRLNETELAGTLVLLIVAGHGTTLNLITNATRALLTHPEQLALVRYGSRSWEAVVEETLRWDSPVNQFPMRYALEDIDVDGTVIPKGAAILASYASTGRDSAFHGEDADRFDITRGPTRHLAFGHGPHFCLGAALARMQAHIALAALFDRFPGLTLADQPDRPDRPDRPGHPDQPDQPGHPGNPGNPGNPGSMAPLPTMISNSTRTLPVLLA